MDLPLAVTAARSKNDSHSLTLAVELNNTSTDAVYPCLFECVYVCVCMRVYEKREGEKG